MEIIKRRVKKIKNQFLNWLVGNSRYKFLIHSFREVTDINLASKILEIDSFRNTLIPIENKQLFERILVLAPHQDDETIGAGGFMVKAAKQGAKVKVVYITDGAQTDLGVSVAEGVKVRNTEAEKALSYVENREISHLGISNLTMDISSTHILELSSIISRFDPEIILLPWILDAPKKHRITNYLFYQTCNKYKINLNIDIWGYQVHNGIIPNIYVNISEQIDVKKKMLECFTSQNTNFQRYDHIAIGMAAWNARLIKSTEPLYLEVFTVIPLEEYLNVFSEVLSLEKNYVPSSFKVENIL